MATQKKDAAAPVSENEEILEKAKAEAAAILEKARAEAEAMLHPDKAPAAASHGEKTVRIKLPKDNYRYRDDVFVGVNGKGWLIKRGIPVEVPESVAEVLEQSSLQDEATAMLIERESAKYENDPMTK